MIPSNVGELAEKIDHLHIPALNIKTMCQFLIKLNMYLSQNPPIIPLGICPRKMENPVYSSFIQNSQKLKWVSCSPTGCG